MNLKKALSANRSSEDTDVNITPVMNIFVILIPFLLLTATFVRIAIIELSLPTLEGASALSEEQTKGLTVLVISIEPTGFEVKTSEKTFPKIPRRGNEYNYNELSEKMKSVKKDFPKLEDVIISPSSEIKYHVIIKVMDICREAGFPNFSISG